MRGESLWIMVADANKEQKQNQSPQILFSFLLCKVYWDLAREGKREDFIKNPWKGRLEHCSTDDTDQYKNWSPKVIYRVNICVKKEHFQYQERMIEELDGDTR